MTPEQLQTLGATERRCDAGQGRPTGAMGWAIGLDHDRTDALSVGQIDAPHLLPMGGQQSDQWDDGEQWGLILREGWDR